MAEFDAQKLAPEIAPTFSGNQVPPLSSCDSVFRQSDLAKRLATSPSASATLIGLDPAKSRQHHSIGVDLAGFPPHDGQTAVIKSGSKMVYAGALL